MVNYERPATAKTPNRSKRILHVGTEKINIIDLPEKRDNANCFSIKKTLKRPMSSLETVSSLIMSNLDSTNYLCENRR